MTGLCMCCCSRVGEARLRMDGLRVLLRLLLQLSLPARAGSATPE